MSSSSHASNNPDHVPDKVIIRHVRRALDDADAPVVVVEDVASRVPLEKRTVARRLGDLADAGELVQAWTVQDRPKRAYHFPGGGR
jgi:hypothetical protein